MRGILSVEIERNDKKKEKNVKIVEMRRKILMLQSRKPKTVKWCWEKESVRGVLSVEIKEVKKKKVNVNIVQGEEKREF